MKLVRRNRDERFPKLSAKFNMYDVVGEEPTELLMQAFAQNRWPFPMTLYIESMSSEQEAILNTPLLIEQIRSINKNLYVTEAGWQREYRLAYTVQIVNETMLVQIFSELFYVAQQNYQFALTNEPNLYYHGYSMTTSSETIEILCADFDGQGAFLLTMKEE